MRERILPHFVACWASHGIWRRLAEHGDGAAAPRIDPPHPAGHCQGRTASDLDLDLCLALLLGPVLYWHILLRRIKGDPAVLAEGVIEIFRRAFGLKKKAGAAANQLGLLTPQLADHCQHLCQFAQP